jgi:hypothetical protein
MRSEYLKLKEIPIISKEQYIENINNVKNKMFEKFESLKNPDTIIYNYLGKDISLDTLVKKMDNSKE